MQRRLSTIGLCLGFSMLLATTAHADWFPDNPADLARAKWIQMPDLSPYPDQTIATGMDVLATLQGSQFAPEPLWKILADDFLCTQSGPITDVHIWGSWWEDILPQSGTLPDGGIAPGGPGSVIFKLSFHSDVPAFQPEPGGPIVPSHPGELLWQGLFAPGQYNVIPYGQAQELFYDPNLDTKTPTGPNGVIGIDQQVWQYNFHDLGPNPFVQTEGEIYWLDMQALVLDTNPEMRALFGWKTRDPNPDRFGGGHFNDDAVWGDTEFFGGPLLPGGISGSGWHELTYPFGHPLEGQSIDLAFVLTVPEPTGLVLAALGLTVLVGVARRTRQRARLRRS